MKTNRGITAAIAVGGLMMSLLALGMLLASCGGGASMGLRQLVAITVQPGNGQAIEPGGAVPFSATGTFNQAPITQTHLPAQWASSDSSVATIDPSTGIATCLALGGPITMTASTAVNGVTVHGSGTLACQVSPDPVVKLDPTTLFFLCHTHLGGACGCSGPQRATLTNVGGATLGIDSIALVNLNNGFFSENNTCGTSLETGQSCDIDVTIGRPRQLGRVSDEVQVTDNAAGSPHVVGLGAEVDCIP